MKSFRALLVVLLSVAVPFTATASVMAPMASCPTSQPDHAQGASVPGQRDCCDPAQAQSGSHKGTGKSSPCKAGAECKSCVTVGMAFISVETAIMPAPEHEVAALTVASPSHHNPFGLWRPPRSI